MIRLLVFSDSHGQTEKMINQIDNLINVDYIIHLGDHANDARGIELMYPEIKHIYVRGNCDFCDPADAEETFEIEGKKFFLTHGHIYGVKLNLENLKKHAEENNFDCVLFGHTHISLCEKFEKTLFLNPGSARETAGVIEIENKKLSGCIINI